MIRCPRTRSVIQPSRVRGMIQRRDQRGMVTAELAMAVMAAIIVLVVMCWAIAIAVLQLRCMDTAAEVARQSARGDQQAAQRAQDDAPAGSRVEVTSAGDRVVVEVSLSARPGGLRIPAVQLRATAETLKEPS